MSAPARPRKAAAKRAPRKAAPAAAPEPPTAQADGPVRIGEGPAAPVEMVTIFSIDDVDYQIPKALPPHPGLRFIRQAADPRIGIDLALSNLLVEVLGPANLRALEEAPNLTRENVRAVFAAVRKHVLGPGGAVLLEAADPS